jgi:hypothetical protein
MRIIDEKNKRSFDSILIMLTPSEASELVSKIKSLDSSLGEHIHVNDLQYEREITFAIYTDQNLHLFTEEIQNILKLP